MASLVHRTARLSTTLPRLGLVTLSDRFVLGIILVGVGLAGWRSLFALFLLGSGDTPLSFVPLVPVLGVVFLWKRFDPRDIRSRLHDPFVDGLFLILLLVFAAGLLLLLPVMMSWDYWLDRLDVPGLVLVLATLIVGAWGLPGLIRSLPALLYMLLAWPLPQVQLDKFLIPSLTNLTAAVARTLAPLLPLGIIADPNNPYSLLVHFHGHVTPLIVTSACAGLNGALGLVIVALPIALLAKGSWEARLTWLAIGAVLTWVFNVGRIIALACSAAIWGPTPTFNLLHPVVGMILFGLSFAVLLSVSARCGLDITAAWRTPPAGGQVTRSPRPVWSRRRCFLLVGIILGAALAESNLGQFSWLTEAALPRVGLATASDLFHAPSGWRVTDARAIGYWKPFFGQSSVASVMNVTPPGRTSPIGVQAIITRDANTFNSYGIENCYIFHGYDLKAVRHVALGNGVTGTVVDYTVGGRRSATLYWLQAVRTPQGLFHQRVVLVADTSGSIGRLAQPLKQSPAPGVIQPVQGVATALLEFLSPWIGGSAGPAYDASNAQLQSLGEAVIAHERRAVG